MPVSYTHLDVYKRQELISSSVDKILHPEIVVFSWLSFAILTLSIAVKLYMFLYNRKYGRLIHSSVMQATATDSISDAIATAAVLISCLLYTSEWQCY